MPLFRFFFGGGGALVVRSNFGKQICISLLLKLFNSVCPVTAFKCLNVCLNVILFTECDAYFVVYNMRY